MRGAIIVFSAVAAIGALTVPTLGQTGASPFDGYWGVTLDCPNEARTGGATGYSFQFLADVKGGVFHGQYGTPGTASSLALDGKIEPDGSSSMTVSGRTGQAFYTAGKVPPNSPYTYSVTAHFEGSQGTGSRVGGRACHFRFVKS